MTLCYRHRRVMGTNPPGGNPFAEKYWGTDFNPKTKSIRNVVSGPGIIGFTEAAEDPNDSTKYIIVKHLSLDPEVDAKVKEEARRRWNTYPHPQFSLYIHDCRDYASGIYNYALAARARWNMDHKVKQSVARMIWSISFPSVLPW